MYSLATTVRIVITFWILTVVWNFYFPILGIVLLALINDGCMLSVSKDRVKVTFEFFLLFTSAKQHSRSLGPSGALWSFFHFRILAFDIDNYLLRPHC